MKKQVFNPYLPLNEYVPDGEPRVFGDRVYIYGSHDEAGGTIYCPGLLPSRPLLRPDSTQKPASGALPGSRDSICAREQPRTCPKSASFFGLHIAAGNNKIVKKQP